MGYDQKKSRAPGATMHSRSSKARARPNRRAIFGFESLEARQLLTVDLTLAGAQTIVGNANVNASNDPATTQHGMMVDINPDNPLRVAGVSHRGLSFTTLGVYHSENGGTTWTTKIIDNTVDLLAPGATRFDPTIAYDSQGRLYVAYGVLDGATTSLIVARSTDNGATFSQITTVDTQGFFGRGLEDFKLATGPDGLGGEAVYVAYVENSVESLIFTDQAILLAGSNDGGLTFGVPVLVNGGFTVLANDLNQNANVSVGPDGQVYVSWLNVTDSSVLVDRDLDGLMGGLAFGADITVVDEATARPGVATTFDLFANLSVPAQPTHGISTAPVLDADRSGKSTDGNLYIAFADRFSGDDIDLWVARSTNQGANWTIVPLARSTATEFLPAIDVDQTSGSANVLFYSTDGDAGTGNDDVNARIKTSIDGGATFFPSGNSSTALSTATSRASAAASGGNDFLDSIGLAVHDGTIQALWSDNRGPVADLEAFTASASFSSANVLAMGNVLTVTGDEAGAAADDIVIRRSAANSAFVEVLLNGNLQFAGLVATLDQINVMGLEGDDNLTIDSSLVPLLINFVGGAGTGDRLFVNDAPKLGAIDYRLNPTSVAVCAPVMGIDTATVFATFDGTAEIVQVDGSQDINRFDVTPSTTARFIVDGNMPNTLPGDLLSIRFVGTTGATLTNAAGNGMWTFTNRMPVQFLDIERFNFLPVVAYSAEASSKGKPTVKVVDGTTGAVISSFLAYESNYREGVRIAVGDVTGDGIPEIITAPGRNRVTQIRIFDAMTGTQIAGYAFNAYASSFKGGAMVAVGDVNADGLNDIVVGPSRGKAEIRTFLNRFATNPTTPFNNGAANRNEFLAFNKDFVGGVSVAVGDVLGDGRAEIIVGSGAGLRDEVRIFDGLQNGSTNNAAPFLRRFKPFSANDRGGVTVAVANLDADKQLELVIGAAVGGQSRLATYDTVNLSAPTNTFFGVFSGSGSNAPVRVAAVDGDFDGLSDIFAAQGHDGKSQKIRRAPLGAFVDFLMENSVEFRNGFFLAADINGIPPFLCV